MRALHAENSVGEKKSEDHYSKDEAQHRFEAALRGARLVGHKPQSEMKLGKRRGKSRKGRKSKQS
jgi:hypothetical protein